MSTTTQPMLVLVADDEHAIRDLVVRLIDKLGMVALAVSDGAAAMQAAAAHQSELLCAILDIQMPIVNGVDAAHAIQRRAPDLPIVLMSGAIPPESVESLKLLRLAGMLHKPFRMAQLHEILLGVAGSSIAPEQAERSHGASSFKPPIGKQGEQEGLPPS